ncbi:mitochondrial copper chaperone [Lojkania enalia]|uniref:Mitochondrial copper chaperone n=1 Tax=Lojkania enalia TaxID=147567 RepID=A0A9P4KID9_9PLEO|nr:mitochondrial copper chaperone [Didymosphaeria enalia]
MSAFGGPGGGQKIQKPTPPERGSFPLDHDGECKSIMISYLQCIRSHRGSNDSECRNHAKSYLQCRMDRNLMAPDSFKNLGFGEDSNISSGSPPATSQPLSAATATPSQLQSQGQDKPRRS